MSAFFCPLFNGQQLFTDQGVINAGGLIQCYLAGTSTPQPTYTDSTGSNPNTNPIVLNSAGRPPQEIWMAQGTPMKFVVQNAQGVQVLGGLYDNIVGVNDTATTSVSEWVSTGLTPTYLSPTSFSVPGNQTGNLQVGRRLQMSITANTVYGYIATSSFGGGVTTVTVTMDSAVLNSGLSAVNYGLLNANNVSIPLTLPSLNVTGTVTANAFNSTSDMRKKINIRKIEDPLWILAGLQGVRFNMLDNGVPSAGLLAQEVETYMPELVVEVGGVKTLNYNGIVGLLVEAVNELRKKSMQ